ncbi:helix-turn-helix domain-containing protein [Gordonia malaquae]|uniref:helix-turn-helix domain-containing protein n=1 Tax=Gordonia malaquae TaxID=410332 RepID=UPI00301A225A
MAVPVHVSPVEAAQAAVVSEALGLDTWAGGLDVLTPSLPEPVRVPSELGQVMRTVIEAMAQGATITIATTPAELTTTVAAKHLGVSRPTLMKMIAQGEIAAHKVGSHTRLRTSDVNELRHRRWLAKRAAFADLRDFEEFIGMDDE